MPAELGELKDSGKAWTWRQRTYQQWLALPTKVRPEEARTQTQLARRIGVTRATLSAWRKKPGFWEAVYEEAKDIIGLALADIVKAQVKEAKYGSTRAARFCFEAMGLISDEIQVHHRVEPLTITLHPDVKKYQQQLAKSSHTPLPLPDAGVDVDVIDSEFRIIHPGPDDAKLHSEPETVAIHSL